MTTSTAAQPSSMSKRVEQSPPLVTVVVCVYNAGEFLRPAVESVVNQTYDNLEIIIIDDGSTDACMETIADIDDQRIRRLSQPNSGKPAALNRALEEMRGEFFVLNDADDVSYPRRIETLVGALLANPKLGAVFSGFDLILDGRRAAPRFQAKNEAQCRDDIEHLRQPSHDPTAMFRASAISGLRYGLDLKLCEGLDFILQVGERYPTRVVGECLYSYRVHSASLTASAEDEKLDYARQVAQRAWRRRGKETTSGEEPALENARAHTRSRRQTLVAHFMESVLDLRDAGEFRRACGVGWSCAMLSPLSPYYYRALAYALAPRGLVRLYRRLKWPDAAKGAKGPRVKANGAARRGASQR